MNALGNKNLPLFVIAKSQNPRPFRNKTLQLCLKRTTSVVST